MITRGARGRRAGLTLGAAACVIACIIHTSACKDDGTHTYIGRLYVEARGCLGTSSTLDAISGDDPGSCSPICLAQHDRDGGRAIYVATMCPPYPYAFDTTGTDPSCPAALAALARNDTCLSDGGDTHPVPPIPDAGTD